MTERILGIIGGVSPEASIDYYRRLVDGHRGRRTDRSYPRLLIDSIDGGDLLPAMLAGDYSLTARAFEKALAQLAAGGAGLAIIASVTTHKVFDEVAATSPIPLLSIVDAVVRATQSAKVRRPALLATRPTMEGDFFSRPFDAAGIELIRPSEPARAWIQEIYFGELVKGVFRDETRMRLESIVDSLRERSAIDGVILGGTELPLILRQPTYSGVPVLDASAIHVDAALDWLFGS